MDKKDINKLVKLYFEYNPHNNKGIGFRAKAHDIITAYATKHNMSYEDIVDCIEKDPMSKVPVWEQFYNYWFKSGKVNKNNENSQYKESVKDSTDVDDWL